MHPLHSDLAARLVVEDRLRNAAAARRQRVLVPGRPALRTRLGTALIRIGEAVCGVPAPTPARSC